MSRIRLFAVLSVAAVLLLQSAPASAQFVVLQAPGSPTLLLVEQSVLDADTGRRLDQWLGPLQRDLPPVADCPIVDGALLAARLVQARRIVAVVAAAQLPALRETLQALPAHIHLDQPLDAGPAPSTVPEALALRAALASAAAPLQLLLATPGH